MSDTGDHERWLRLDRDREQIDELARRCERMLVDGIDIESILTFLRRERCTKGMTIFILRKVAGITTADGKEPVDHSKAWSDVYERDKVFHDMLEEVVVLLQEEADRD